MLCLLTLASVNDQLTHSAEIFQQIFGKRLVKLSGPQHGFVTDVQDNMVETKDFNHPFFGIPVHSLYGEVRKPTKEMLEGIDTFVVDLQDVGTRVYTYIHTLSYVLEACADENIKVVVLDRPNPIGGQIIEGNILEEGYKSFCWASPHSNATRSDNGGDGQIIKSTFSFLRKCELESYRVKKLVSKSIWGDLDRHWILPSPNLPTWEAQLALLAPYSLREPIFPKARNNQIARDIRHPKIEAFSFAQHLNSVFTDNALHGIVARPQVFLPTFQNIKAMSAKEFSSTPSIKKSKTLDRWADYLPRTLHLIGDQFEWSDRPYEYQFEGLAIDFINGTDQVRKWVEKNGTIDELYHLEQLNQQSYLEQKKSVELY